MHLVLASVQICMRHVGRRGNYSEKEKWLLFKKNMSNWPNISCAYTNEICAKYEVSLIKPVVRRTVTHHDYNTRWWWQTTLHDNDCLGSLLFMPDEPIIIRSSFPKLHSLDFKIKACKRCKNRMFDLSNLCSCSFHKNHYNLFIFHQYVMNKDISFRHISNLYISS